ncbi:MAG: HD domain-containing protein [Candidatus Heimdallarchaeota archaeon]|nr:HD domain-containing protein [Candidatus Heimdallarchaeota archaeon]MBY8994233.1 HD domain-containing protein [Candidatus Heimdallarchaeota archaeon]
MGKISENLEFVDYIYDPVWKNIPITQLEKDIIESDIFRRLRNIKQMSLAYISFSGANHTRSEHSIGTMHVAYLIASRIEKLKEHSDSILKEKHSIESGYKETMQFLRIAALLHDLGHPPFSHAIEWVFERNPELYPGINYSHDDYTQELIRKNDELKLILKNEKICSPKNIADFLSYNIKKLPKPIAILYPLLNSDLDFDKVDYIIRDNYHCGLPANIDIHSIMDSFKIRLQKPDQVEMFANIEIMFKLDKLFVIENLLLSRKQLISIIQQETNNRIANQMLMCSTQNYLREKKDSLDEVDYKQLIQEFHESWTDYDLVTNITRDTNNEEQASYLNRALKGKLMKEIIKIEMFDIEPQERLYFYLFSKYKDRKMTFEKNINKKLKSNFLIDFIFTKPPPLAIRLVPDYEEKVASVEYSGEPVAFALHSKSNIVNGILKDSYSSSFIAVYSDKKEKNISRIIEDLRFELRAQNLDIRKELILKKEIIGDDLVLLVLAAIRRLSKEKFEISRLWATGVKRLQDFIFKLRNEISFKCPDFDYLTFDYSSQFDSLMTKLVTLGLVDQRKKHVSIRTMRNEKEAFRYLNRNDYSLNSNGEFFVNNLPTELLKIRDKLYEKMLENFEAYHRYLTRSYNLMDTVRQKDMRPDLDKKGLPIIDI